MYYFILFHLFHIKSYYSILYCLYLLYVLCSNVFTMPVFQESFWMTNMTRVIITIQWITKMNLWERAKVSIIFQKCYMYYINYLTYTDQFLFYFVGSTAYSAHWSGAEASMADMMPLITARSSRGMLVGWVPILSSLCCLINSLGFCLSFTLVDLKVWIYLYYPTTGASLMFTALLRTTR